MGKPEEKRRIERPRRIYENNIKIDLKEIGWEDMDLIHLAQNRDQWLLPVRTLMKFWIPYNAVIFLTT
jgi:hypothetical protein